MKLRHKLRLVLIAWFTGGFALLMLAVEVDQRAISLVIAYMAVMAFLTASIRCPNCGDRVLWRRSFAISWIPKRCKACGTALSNQ
jgi:predicted RNA-binding Zn-ribbon protein involved in translation (DUF1610 family)